MSIFDVKDPLEDPKTVSGVQRLPVNEPESGNINHHSTVFPQNPPTNPHPIAGPVHASTLLTGDPQHDKIVSAVSAILSLRDDQVRAKMASQQADEAERKSERNKRIKIWVTIATVVLGGGGGGGTWYVKKTSTPEISNEEAIRRHDVDGRLKTQEIKTNLIQTKVDDIDEGLEEHIEEQRIVNEASKLSTVRQEMMLEELLRSNGRRPPPKPQAQIDAEKAIGIDPPDGSRGR